MLLKQINRLYWYIGIAIYAVFSFASIRSMDYLYLYLASLIAFISFGIVISWTCSQKFSFFIKENLIVSVFFYSLFAVGLFHLTSYIIEGDTFVFSKKDALDYFNNSIRMSKMSLGESYKELSLLGDFDDWGAYIWITSIFRIIPSKLFLNISYCVLGTASSVMLFDIGRNLMPRRYAYMAALTFSIASFTVLLHAQCLKETVLVFLVVASFNSFYSFLRYKNVRFLVFTLLWSLSILFFRIPVSLFLLLSFVLTLVLMYSRGILIPIFSVILALTMFSGSYLVTYSYDRYMRGGDVEAIMERKMGLSKGGGVINQMADPLAALIGPFPSIVAKAINRTTLYASGLLFRLLLAFPFIIGVIYAFRHKKYKIFPLIFFFLANAIGVAISVKGLELRISLPHLPMMYLVAFWLLAKYDYHRVRQQLPTELIYGCLASIVAICFIWNSRGI